MRAIPARTGTRQFQAIAPEQSTESVALRRTSDPWQARRTTAARGRERCPGPKERSISRCIAVRRPQRRRGGSRAIAEISAVTCSFLVRPLGFEPRTCGLRAGFRPFAECRPVAFVLVAYRAPSGASRRVVPRAVELVGQSVGRVATSDGPCDVPIARRRATPTGARASRAQWVAGSPRVAGANRGRRSAARRRVARRSRSR